MKKIVEKVKEVIKKEEKKEEKVVTQAPKFDPNIPENKQRWLR